MHTQVRLVVQELGAYMHHVSQIRATYPEATAALVHLEYGSAQDKRSMISYFLGIIKSITNAIASPGQSGDAPADKASELDRFDDATKNLLVAACECWTTINACYYKLKYEHCKEIQNSRQNSMQDHKAKLIDASSKIAPFYNTDAVGEYIQVCESIVEKVMNSALDIVSVYPGPAIAIRDMCQEAVEAIVIPIQELTRFACARDTLAAHAVMEPNKSINALSIGAPADMDKLIEEINGHLIKILTDPVLAAICYSSLRQSVTACKDTSEASIRKMRSMMVS